MTLFFVLLLIVLLFVCNLTGLYGHSAIISSALAGTAVHWAIVSTSLWSVTIATGAVFYAICAFTVFIAAVAVVARRSKT